MALLCDIGEALAVMACTLGKTSFAVTLLRIVVKRWMVVLLWFVIVTMNLVNILTAFFIFFQCEDPRHLWNPAIVSKCWPSDVFTHYSLFVGGKSPNAIISKVVGTWSDIPYSLFRCPGFCSGASALDNRVEPSDEKERENRSGMCDELGSVVSIAIND